MIRVKVEGQFMKIKAILLCICIKTSLFAANPLADAFSEELRGSIKQKYNLETRNSPERLMNGGRIKLGGNVLARLQPPFPTPRRDRLKKNLAGKAAADKQNK